MDVGDLLPSWNTSYVYGLDNISGWGPRYFYTYYSEFDDKKIYRIVEVVIFAVMFIISVAANISIAICVLKFPNMITVTNCFVLNLAIADLVFAASIPPVAFTRITTIWKYGPYACKLIPYIQLVSGIVLLWTLAIISMDRHRCIVVPPYRSQMTPKQACIYSVIIWILACVLFTPVFLWFREFTSYDNKTICTMIFPQSETIHYSVCFVIPLVLLACLLPMIILVYNYQKIFQKILSTQQAWATPCILVRSALSTRTDRRQSELSISDIFVPWSRKTSLSRSSPCERQSSLSQHEEIRLNKHIKVVRVLFFNVIVVLVMWLPITVVMLLIYVDGSRPNDDQNFFLRSHHFVIALMMAFLNTLINPVLYGVLSDNFRVCLSKLWTCSLKEQSTPSSAAINGIGVTRATWKPSFANNSLSGIQNE